MTFVHNTTGFVWAHPIGLYYTFTLVIEEDEWDGKSKYKLVAELKVLNISTVHLNKSTLFSKYAHTYCKT